MIPTCSIRLPEVGRPPLAHSPPLQVQLAGALADVVGDHAVDPHHRQQQRGGAERAEQDGQAARGGLCRDDARHASRVFANALLNTAWRNGPVESLHAATKMNVGVDPAGSVSLKKAGLRGHWEVELVAIRTSRMGWTLARTVVAAVGLTPFAAYSQEP